MKKNPDEFCLHETHAMEHMESVLGKCKLLILIVNHTHTERACELLIRAGVIRPTAMLARGSAQANWLEMLGLADDERVLVFGIVREERIPIVFALLFDELHLEKQGAGIAFTIPLDAHTGIKSLFKVMQKHREALERNLEANCGCGEEKNHESTSRQTGNRHQSKHVPSRWTRKL